MPVNSGTGTLPWKTSNSLAMQEREHAVLLQRSLDKDFWAPTHNPTGDMGTCLLQSRAHSTCSAALWGKRSPSPARAVTSSGRGKGKAGHSSQLCQSSSGSPATTHKPFPNPHPFKLPVGLPAHIYAQVCSKSTCPLPQLIHLFPAPLQFALTQVQDTAPVPGTIQCQTTLQPSYNLTRVPSSISGAAQQLCSLSPTS